MTQTKTSSNLNLINVVDVLHLSFEAVRQRLVQQTLATLPPLRLQQQNVRQSNGRVHGFHHVHRLDLHDLGGSAEIAYAVAYKCTHDEAEQKGESGFVKKSEKCRSLKMPQSRSHILMNDMLFEAFS